MSIRKREKMFRILNKFVKFSHQAETISYFKYKNKLLRFIMFFSWVNISVLSPDKTSSFSIIIFCNSSALLVHRICTFKRNMESITLKIDFFLFLQ